MADHGTSARRFTVIAARDDRDVARSLVTHLQRAGLAEGRGPDVVVLLSNAALADEQWRVDVAAIDASPATRPVPILLNRRIDWDEVPDRLGEINGVLVADKDPASTWDMVTDVLRSDHLVYDQAQELARLAERYARAHYRADLLIDDVGRASEAGELVDRLAGDPLLRPMPLTVDFARRSMAYARRRRRRRVARWVVGIGSAIFITVSVIVTVISFGDERQVNKAAVVLSTDVAQDGTGMPAWTAINAVAVLRDGGAADRRLARLVLRDLLNVPWSGGSIRLPSGSVEAIEPLAGGQQAAALIWPGDDKAVLTMFDLRTGLADRSMTLDGLYSTIDTSADERRAIVAGQDGVLLVDLDQQQARPLVEDQVEASEVQIDENGDVVIAASDGRLYRTSTAGGGLQLVGAYDAVLDIRTVSDATIQALVSPTRRTYVLVDALSGRELATATVPEPRIYAGAVSSEGGGGVVVAGDNQLWEIGNGASPRPTGIAVPNRTTALTGLPDGRYAIDGQLASTRVVHVPTGVTLGRICTDVPPPLARIEASHDGTTVGCLGWIRNSFWAAPSAAVPPETEGAADDLSDDDLVAAVKDRLSGCWDEVQLENIGAGTIDVLDLHLCDQALGSG